MIKLWSAGIILVWALAGINGAALAADTALLQILLENKLITQEQFDALNKAEAGKDRPVTAVESGKKLPAPDEGLLDVLLSNGLITQEQYAALQVKSAEDKGRKQDKEKATVTMADGLKFKSPDGDFTAQLGMRVELDSAWYGDNMRDYADGTELRRARLTMSGTFLQDWDYKMEADFAGTIQASNSSPGSTNNVVVTDAFLRYNGLKPVAITVGNFKVPFSLEAASSGKYLTFMERGLPFAFMNLRSLGGMISTNGNNWTAAAGLFGDTVTQQSNDDEGWGAAGRVTYAPVYMKDRVLHLGAGGQWREPDANASASTNQTVRFRSKPESNIITDDFSGTGSGGRLVDTGNIGGDVNDYTLLNVEAAGVYGPFSLQGEYIHTLVDRQTGGNLDFNGFYIYGSFFLTPDFRNYKADKGVFDIIQPANPLNLRSGGWGAWEVAARYSGIDLNDADIKGGDERNITLGLNWYPNSFVRFMANYIHVLDIDGGVHDNEDLDIVQVRAQVVY